jgi:hypothetical protein
MAVMFPREIPQSVFDDPLRDAEARTYRSLRDSLSDEYRVFYSVAWLAGPGKTRTGDGEADFVVVHPSKGIMVLEVKGGAISRDGPTGNWFSRDRHDQYHTIKDPVLQARNNKYAILDKLKDVPGLGSVFFRLAHGALFPHCQPTTVELGTDAPPQIFGFASHMTDLGPRVESIYDFWNRQDERTFDPLTDNEIKRIEDTLATTFELNYSLAAVVEDEEAEIISLTEEQYNLLGYLSNVRRAVVTGGAGTGKTMLAMEKARRLADEGFRVLFTCYNRPLADHLSKMVSSTENLEVLTYHQLCRQFAQDAGVKIEGRASSPEFFENLGGSLIESLDGVEKRFDAIIVDEGQDFEPAWWDALQFALSDPTDGVLYAFADPNQAIYGEQTWVGAGLTEFPLTNNVRNTRSIHASVLPYYEGPPFTSLGPAGQPINKLVAEDGHQVVRAVSRLLHLYITGESMKPEDIVILSGAGQGRGCLRPGDQVGNYELSAPSETEPGTIGLETVRRFKGLERRVVILVDIEQVTDSRELSYVALTRARSLLAVVGSEEAIDRLVSD